MHEWVDMVLGSEREIKSCMSGWIWSWEVRGRSCDTRVGG